ncbi:24284_t:CDS:1 [Gigaspora margarita]|uniref:24284_t:CDS:1 n=1 Tax=Gigaspora margarita TaxID=4874 RepID=A0ABN7VGJ8_GIGMA|nr:24284_t:CDS:1 [Gigaspora margarita]
MTTPETPRDRRNRLARESYARRRSLLMAEQLEHRRAQQREAYRLRTEAESSQQTEHRRKNRRAAYVRHTQQRCASNAARIQIYDTTTVERHHLGSMDVECSHCCAMHWIEKKVSGSVFTTVFSTCCANGKVQLPTINQPPEPLLSLLTGEDSRSRNF